MIAEYGLDFHEGIGVRSEPGSNSEYVGSLAYKDMRGVGMLKYPECSYISMFFNNRMRGAVIKLGENQKILHISDYLQGKKNGLSV